MKYEKSCRIRIDPNLADEYPNFFGRLCSEIVGCLIAQMAADKIHLEDYGMIVWYKVEDTDDPLYKTVKVSVKLPLKSVTQTA